MSERGGAVGGGTRHGEVLSALASPTRRALLESIVERGEATATDLAPGLPVSRQAVMKHLALLQEAGLVESRRSGREVLYRLRPRPVAGTAEWLRRLAAEWDARLATIRDIAEARDAETPSGRRAGNRGTESGPGRST